MLSAEFLRPDLPYEYMGSGIQKESYKVGNRIVKLLKQPLVPEDAFKLVLRLKRENDLIVDYMTPYVDSAQFAVGSTSVKKGYATVMVEHELFEGITMREAIIKAYRGYNSSHMRCFFQQALDMYEKKREIPDLVGSPRIPNAYFTFFTKNVIVQELEGKVLYPMLIDTDFFRRAEQRFIGPAHKRLIAAGVRGALQLLP